MTWESFPVECAASISASNFSYDFGELSRSQRNDCVVDAVESEPAPLDKASRQTRTGVGTVTIGGGLHGSVRNRKDIGFGELVRCAIVSFDELRQQVTLSIHSNAFRACILPLPKLLHRHTGD